MLKAAKTIVPPLLAKFHKGQMGRVLVVGGSEDYTGAPYFAAMASALTGADMSHILCSSGAAPVIKTYSPNLMVHPYLHDEGNSSQLSSKIEPLLERMHVVLIGPGLGRDKAMLNQVAQIIGLARAKKLPLVIDADGLFLVQQQPSLVSTYHPQSVILTPNVVEFSRLLKATNIPENADQRESAEKLARHLGCVVLVKGSEDIVSNGKETVNNSTEGSLRRVSGQGDTLSGTLATFVAWTEAYKARLWVTDPLPSQTTQDLLVIAAWAASSTTRTASRLAFARKGRATVTTDVNNAVGEAFEQIFGSSSTAS